MKYRLPEIINIPLKYEIAKFDKEFRIIAGKYVNHDEHSHRLDGPSIIWENGEKDYFVDSVLLTKEEWERHPKVIAHKNKLKAIKLLNLLNKEENENS